MNRIAAAALALGLAEAGHVPQVEQPDVLAATIPEFLNSRSAGADEAGSSR
jgi:hypothetical protein